MRVSMRGTMGACESEEVCARSNGLACERVGRERELEKGTRRGCVSGMRASGKSESIEKGVTRGCVSGARASG
eukprot:1158773-Pelagomonas_calceolata.AAC.30